MNLREIEERVATLQTAEGSDFLFELLCAYGIPKASVTRLRSGSYNRSDRDGEYLWKDKVFYRFDEGPDEQLYAIVDDAMQEKRIIRERPRFVIATNGRKLVAADLRAGDRLDIAIDELPGHVTFFLPWASIEKTQIENVSLADRKAAEKMARLYDEIIRVNSVETQEQIHELNVFFSRLLFCFFAEDTGVFDTGSFTNAIGSLSGEGGEGVHELLDQIFDVLNTKPEERIGVPSHLQSFAYVNGKLFERHSSAPAFSAKARSIVLECGSLDWSQINPDIFGSMMQAVVHPGDRESLGMHYTSVENIRKVIKPLFLDELQLTLDAADSKAKLIRLHDRIAAIKCFDPACGSGNFLVIAYKELRRLEHRILSLLQELDPQAPLTLFEDSRIKLENFYGIEIDDFAHEVAILSLWLAKHQMNIEFREMFGADIRLVPLRDTANIVCENAARTDWDTICPVAAGDEVYLLSNPPYQGGTKQTAEQKADLVIAFADREINRYMDYVSAWLIKGAGFVVAHDAELGFVTTNSVTQGNHVGLLWPHIRDAAAEISFAYTSFPWSNSAKGKAGVTCVIIGLSSEGKRTTKWLYTGGTRRRASTINGYLVPDGADVIVFASNERINAFPPMVFGSMPRDGGNLILSRQERDDLLQSFPEADRFVKRYTGAEEFLQGGERFCIWVEDVDEAAAAAMPPLRRRFELVRAERLASKAESTRKAAQVPHRFVQVAHRETTAIMVPRVSSQRRQYIPIGFLDGDTVINDQGNAVYGAEPWLFALLTSRMHNVWVRAVGGRMKTDYRYSATLCYNTFPVPPLSEDARALLSERSFAVLEAREHHSDKTLAQLYGPEMPDELREVHQFVDGAVDQLYRKRPFQSDDERLEMLFGLYQAANNGQKEPARELETIDA